MSVIVVRGEKRNIELMLRELVAADVTRDALEIGESREVESERFGSSPVVETVLSFVVGIASSAAYDFLKLAIERAKNRGPVEVRDTDNEEPPQTPS